MSSLNLKSVNLIRETTLMYQRRTFTGALQTCYIFKHFFPFQEKVILHTSSSYLPLDFYA